MAVPMRGTSYPTAKPAKKKNRIKETAMTNQYAKVEPIIIDDDELVEITPKNIRMRKKILDSTQRYRSKR